MIQINYRRTLLAFVIQEIVSKSELYSCMSRTNWAYYLIQYITYYTFKYTRGMIPKKLRDSISKLWRKKSLIQMVLWIIILFYLLFIDRGYKILSLFNQTVIEGKKIKHFLTVHFQYIYRSPKVSGHTLALITQSLSAQSK